MNWLDKAVAWVSPQAGAKRLRARAALATAGKFLRSYEGAKTGRRTENWQAGAGSANREIESAGERLRQRSRDLVRNDPYGRRAIAALVANAIGTGITADSSSPAGAVWMAWAKECDFYGELDFCGLQALVARCIFEAGECLIVRVRMLASQAGKSGVPLKIKVLEPDYLDATRHGPQGNGNFCFSGIECDPQGRRVAYHLWQQHPGDAQFFLARMTSMRIPAEDVIHVFEKERPGQLRGVPRLSSVILQLRDLNEYNEAILVKKKIEACFAAFVTTDEENRTITPNTATSSEDASDGTSYSARTETLSPGMVEYLKPGETVEFGNPSSTAGGGEFEASHLRGAAMGAGLTYEILTGDLSRVNFSSMRAGRQEFKALIEQFRWMVFVPMFCQRVQDWFEEAAFMAGRVRTRGYDFKWTPPRWEYVNPLDDVKTDKEELSAGLSSWSSQVRKRGEDPVKVLDEIQKDQEAFKKAGVTVDFGVGAESKVEAVGATGTAIDTAGSTPAPAAKRELTLEDIAGEVRRELAESGSQASPSITVNTPAPQVDIRKLDLAPVVNIPPAVVNVEAPNVRIDVPKQPRVVRVDYIRDPVTQEIIAHVPIYETEPTS